MLEKSALYVVATPIGNLSDISLRALDVLAKAEVIAAEHVQNSKHLLAAHAITAKLIALHQHNEAAVAGKIVTLLESGKSVALITDAGTPGISDPGAIVVQRVRESGYRVVPVPGANAAVCALSAAGMMNPHFLFYGFLPTKSGLRKRELTALKSHPYTLIFYEAPHRILECIADMIDIFGAQREITLARELTKLFETIHSGTLADALSWLQADTNQQKGEFVLLLSGAETPDKSEISDQARHTLTCLLVELPLKQAVKLTAEITGENKNALYQLALDLKTGGDAG
ncbi:16S rRNA (cytidine(1402)-2'-O)-methyltransferase [Nitrosomonas oligotropha]|uniref:Ribosomal RNA small subunit methyltransferase I n=1 Tax=Nitrosomonas oligotropha TaxID=42354 RepID=A0A1H8QNZ9_9PROT|nr:16S rRNA (cytidine(1402)-2'-O)-methyltransferase [Nitrosomonas oligotropha]SDW87166.1 16S rRNA (cytidine1402-2'-O)-methyltransferase [Nitrosomonas oligotropha]SEO55708.1 16S rRNA (cytidine1402-2'-O)-methyltransferase [Nitrosomonas oligotropha]